MSVLNLALVANEHMANISNYLMYSALAVYTLAFLANVAEWTFGTRSKVARQSAALTAFENNRRGAEDESAAEQAVETAPARAAVTVSVNKAGGGTATLTRSASGPAVLVDGSGDAGQDDDGPGMANGDERADVLGRMAISLTGLAFVLHLGSVIARGVATDRAPWGDMYEFSTAFALMAVAFYLGLLLAKKRVRWLGLPVTFAVVLTLGLAVAVLYTPDTELVPALHSYWLWIHVTCAIISSGALFVAGVSALFYLFRDSYETALAMGKASRFGSVWARLPSAAKLDKLSYRINAAVFPLWTFTIIAGAIWAENAWGHYWAWDPKETWAFITWVAYAAYLHARATGGWKGRRAAYIALIAFGCFTFNYFGVNIFVHSKHSYAGV